MLGAEQNTERSRTLDTPARASASSKVLTLYKSYITNLTQKADRTLNEYKNSLSQRGSVHDSRSSAKFQENPKALLLLDSRYLPDVRLLCF